MLHFWFIFFTFNFWDEMQPESIFKREMFFEPPAPYCWRMKNLLLHYMHIYMHIYGSNLYNQLSPRSSRKAKFPFRHSAKSGLQRPMIEHRPSSKTRDVLAVPYLALPVSASKTSISSSSRQTCPASKAVYSTAADSHDQSNNVCVHMCVPSAADSNRFIQSGTISRP